MAIGARAGRVHIAGGGIGGLTAALCLARAGFEAAVFERMPEFGQVGAGIQISPNGARVLHHLGLAEALEACASLPAATEIRNWRSGRLVSTSPLGEAVARDLRIPLLPRSPQRPAAGVDRGSRE